MIPNVVSHRGKFGNLSWHRSCIFSSTYQYAFINFPLPTSPLLPHLFPTAPLLFHFSTFLPTFPSFSLFLSFHPSLPPLAPCFELGLVSVDPEVCHWAGGLISGWGNALRRGKRGQGPGLGASTWTCCLPKRWEKLLLPWCLGIWTDSAVQC